MTMSSDIKMQNMFNFHYDKITKEKNLVLPNISNSVKSL